MTTYLDFEKPIAELESKIAELRHLPNSGDVDIAEEVMRLQDKVQKQLRATYAKLTPWQRVQVARHAERPHAQAYIDRLITEYMPLAGDRVSPVLVASGATFALRALTTLEPFHGSSPRRYPLADLTADLHVDWRRDHLAHVDLDQCLD